MRTFDLIPFHRHPVGLDRMNRLFDDMWRGFDRPLFAGDDLLRVDVAEDDKAVTISAELPGLDETDVEVTLADDRLVIRGEKKAETSETSEDGYSYQERSYGRFERSFPVGPNVEAEKVEAKFDKGVLTVTLPKTEQAAEHVRKIPISH